MKKFDKYIFLFIFLSGIILWQGLLPGYILNLDMIFAPEMGVVSNLAEGFGSSLPIGYILHWLCLIFPAWLVQKAILLFLFFIIGYLAYRFLPVGENKNIRLFSALLYLSNPFVYSRFLAGHWMHLFAYGFLPLFIYHLLALQTKNNWQTCLKFFSVLFLISLFSIHFFIMVCLISLVWFLYLLINYLSQKKTKEFWLLFKNLLFTGLVFLIVSSYWLIPAFSRPTPVEQRFGLEHWQAFSAGGYKDVGTFLNVASLNGFWGERNPWAGYFLWPQDYVVFWFAFVVVFVLGLIGVWNGLKRQKTRFITVFFAGLGVLTFIFATGVGETIFKPINFWLYEHTSLWSGFRDSQKFSGFLVLSYAIFAGLGLEAILDFIKKSKPVLENIFLSFILIIPILFGFLIWGGFRGQIQPVWYPTSWSEAKSIINHDNSDSRVLFLPWHGYLSLNFNNNLVIANPARRFFGPRAVVSKSVELEDIYNQEANQEYLVLDKIITSSTLYTTDEVIDFLITQKIKYIVYFQDLKTVDNLQYNFLSSGKIKRILEDQQLVMYEIKAN
ncbi:MAG TPA: hypothetical protein DEB09_00585 [Candidatus Magasanikbacteria bacterium]|nr:hypothetical protein [Candidatus Magasanikbacteria bacterium]